MAGKAQTSRRSQSAQQQEIEQRLARIPAHKLRKLLRAYDEQALLTADSDITKTLLSALKKYKNGDFKVRLQASKAGFIGELTGLLNDCLEQQQVVSEAVASTAEGIARRGQFTSTAYTPLARGQWGAMLQRVDEIADALIQPTIEATAVLDDLCRGDLSQTCALSIGSVVLRGEAKALPETINKLVRRLQQYHEQQQILLQGEKTTIKNQGLWRETLKIQQQREAQLASLQQQQQVAISQLQVLVEGDLSLAHGKLQTDATELEQQSYYLAKQLQMQLSVMEDFADLIDAGDFSTELDLDHTQGCWRAVFALQNRVHQALQQVQADITACVQAVTRTAAA